MPLAPVVRVQPNFEHEHLCKKSKITQLLPIKLDRINCKYFFESKEELLLFIYATEPRLSSNPQILKLVKQLRGGGWGLDILGTAAILGVLMFIVSIGESFFFNNTNPGWGLGLERPNVFQPQTAPHRYPPVYDLLFPRRTSYADRPRRFTNYAYV
jgi:hypothetical protein